jgi:cytochrome c-type biogenesis protein CcmH
MIKKIILVLLFLPLLAMAEAQPMGDDPAVEERLKALSTELRCLVCQNQTLADSSAPLTDYLVVRYGDFVRYRPPVKSQTLLLWVGPTILLLAGLGGLWWALRKRNALLPDENDNEEGEEA